MERYAVILAVVLISLAATVTAQNEVNQRINQTVEGEMIAEGSSWYQRAGLGSMILGNTNVLDQLIEQSLDRNNGFLLQDSNLTSVLAGNESIINQVSRQMGIGNEIDNLLSEDSPIMKNNEAVVVVGNNSYVGQITNQTIMGNDMVESILSQIASETTTVIGQGNIARQQIDQEFINKTLENNGKLEQSSSLRSTVVGSLT